MVGVGVMINIVQRKSCPVTNHAGAKRERRCLPQMFGFLMG
jgi:hypothetical protein